MRRGLRGGGGGLLEAKRVHDVASELGVPIEDIEVVELPHRDIGFVERKALLVVVNDILDMSRIETGELRPLVQPVYLDATVRSCIRLMADRARKANVTLAVEPFDGLPPLVADERMLKTPRVFTMDELMRLPSVSRFHFIECGANTGMEWGNVAVPTCQYTHGMLGCSEFTGVPLKILLEMAGVDFKRGRFVLAEGADGSSMTRTSASTWSRSDRPSGSVPHGCGRSCTPPLGTGGVPGWKRRRCWRT